MIRRLADVLSRWSARWVPDPFVIAILLTLVTFALVWVTTGTDPLDGLGNWGGRLDDGELLPGARERGLWSLLLFGMQMCLVLVSGHALASAPLMKRGLRWLAGRVTTARGAVLMVALVAMAGGLLNWGLGLIGGALIAREVGRACVARGVRVHYPLLGAAGYTGLLVWHGGLSGSAPLKITTAAGISEILPDTVALDPVPLSQTLFSPLNLTVMALLLVGVPLILWLMHPRDDVRGFDAYQPDEDDDDASPAAAPAPTTPAERLNRSFLLAAVLAVMCAAYLGLYVDAVGLDQIGLNEVNLAFIAAGLLMHGGAKAYGDAIADGARACAGVILQFPFYAGIMGLMAVSGLMKLVATEMSQLADDTTLGPLTFLSAGVMNLFVPSGGGQFAIQGGIVIESAQALQVPIEKAVLAFCYGDQWTNMLQPFWALPLLGITGLTAKDLIGYSAALMLLVTPIFLVPLLLF